MGFATFMLIVFALVLLFVVLTSNSRNGRADQVRPRVCTHCGDTHPQFAQFCKRCGKKLT